MNDSNYEGCNVLLLGVSYVDGYSSVDDVVRDVCSGNLSQIDGRDVARCLKLEELLRVSVYTVSLETAATYRVDRHFSGDFNHRNFIRDCKNGFGGCQFKHIILDYFWMPPGSWEQHHWKRSFFRKTLVGFAKHELLLKPGEGCERGGMIFLPFSFYCFKELVLAESILSQWYSIAYLRRNDLNRNLLWYATQKIGRSRMLSVFGKQIDQEELYCTFDPNRMQQMLNTEDFASLNDLKRATVVLKDLKDVRFIVLSRL